MRTVFFAMGMLVMVASSAHAQKWQLVWSDEFDYQGLPDKTKWSYEEGFVRNHERQYYTRSRLENARVEGGMLVIECRKEHFTPTNHEPVEYTAASLNEAIPGAPVDPPTDFGEPSNYGTTTGSTGSGNQ